MKWKLALWILPVLGLGLGYAWAHLSYTGRLETWQRAGSPGEKIARILGVKEGRKILVVTEKGKFFSFPFYAQGEVALPDSIVWESEETGAADPMRRGAWSPDVLTLAPGAGEAGAENRSGSRFATLPPFFQAKQYYGLEYLHRVEGDGLVTFAVDPDGELWMWNHAVAGLAGLGYYFYPAIGFLAGLGMRLLIGGGNRLSRALAARRSRPGKPH